MANFPIVLFFDWANFHLKLFGWRHYVLTSHIHPLCVLSVIWEHCYWRLQVGFVDGRQDNEKIFNVKLPISATLVYLVGFYLCVPPDNESFIIRLKNFIRCRHSKYLIRISYNADQSKPLTVCHIYYTHQKAMSSLISFINGFWLFLFTHHPYKELCAWWTAH